MTDKTGVEQAMIPVTGGGNDKWLRATVTTQTAISDIPSAQWNHLVPTDAPMLRHEFLHALEASGSCSVATGWLPCHLTLYLGKRLAAAAPCYRKDHSWGEYIFDWAWANAYQRAGLEYYPKLLIAVPFTPVTGPRLLFDPTLPNSVLVTQLVRALPEAAQQLGASSIHCLFTTPADNEYLRQEGFVHRESYQFHWCNQAYTDFGDFLARLAAKKRKNIQRERRRVRQAGVTTRWLGGNELSDEVLDLFLDCYHSTAMEHGAHAYLNHDFFARLTRDMPGQVRLLVANRLGRDIACAFFLEGSESLYGRYWGALEHVPNLHFEACYYAPIAYCIDRGLKRFEAGAQGEHKLSRGLVPRTTLSAHWLRHPGFHQAVADYTREEQDHLSRYTRALHRHTPFRQGGGEESGC